MTQLPERSIEIDIHRNSPIPKLGKFPGNEVDKPFDKNQLTAEELTDLTYIHELLKLFLTI